MGVRRFGVPVGGWFDRESAMAANLLARRALESPCLELAMAWMTFQATHPFEFALTGGTCQVQIDGLFAGVSGVFSVKQGSSVLISTPQVGARAYLSARFLELSPTSSRVLRNDRLAIETSQRSFGILRLADIDPLSPAPMRVVLGPQADKFDLRSFTDQVFTVSQKSNRVGIRLLEAPLPHSFELPSEPAGFGAIQVTPDGTPIILGPDGPTIGGYPKIAHVISADLDRLAQLRPVQQISFDVVPMDEARSLAADHSRRLQRRFAELALAVEKSGYG